MILRANQDKPLSHMIFKPALCITLQGAKWTTFGKTRFDYRAGQTLVVGVEMPAFGRVTEAGPSEPYLGVIIKLDLGTMREVMEGLETPLVAGGNARCGILVTDFAGPLADCVLRAVRLLYTPIVPTASSARFMLYGTALPNPCGSKIWPP